MALTPSHGLFTSKIKNNTLTYIQTRYNLHMWNKQDFWRPSRQVWIFRRANSTIETISVTQVNTILFIHRDSQSCKTSIVKCYVPIKLMLNRNIKFQITLNLPPVNARKTEKYLGPFWRSGSNSLSLIDIANNWSQRRAFSILAKRRPK